MPAGRALGRRRVRLLPQLRARVPHRRSAVGGDGGRDRIARAGFAPWGGGSDPTLARRARAPSRTAARHDSLDRRGNRTGPGDRALPALRIPARRALSGQDRRGRELTRPYTRSTYARRGSVMAIGL